MLRHAALVLLVFSLPGCFSAICVDTWDGADPDGLPFYAKVGRMKQTTVLTRTWMSATLSVFLEKKDGSRSKPLTVQLAIAERDWDPNSAMTALTAASAAANQVAARLENLADATSKAAEAFTNEEAGGLALLTPIALFVATTPEPLPADSPIVERRLANDVAIVTEADYAHPYSFNVRSPIFGSGSGTLEVASDGTLSKGSASADTSKLADVLPVKDLLVKALELAPAAALVETLAGDHFVVVAEVRLDGCKFMLTRRFEIDASWTPAQLSKVPLTFSEAQGFSRVALEAPVQEDARDKIEFSGSVALPKE